MALHSSSCKVLSQRNCLNIRGATCVGLFNFRKGSPVRIITSRMPYCTPASVQYPPSSKRRSRGPVMAAKKGSSGSEQDGKYKDTVNLPKTIFGMRANALVREPELQKLWEDNQVFKRVAERNDGGTFILHDGPPYANGDLHIGHALNKILKDIINRYKLLQNYKVHYVPGWDCHGLPIELKVLQSMDQESRKELTPLKLRAKAAKFAKETVKNQMSSFKRYGVWASWDKPYLTLDPEYEAAQIEVFGQMALKEYIYRGRKPVHWSPSSRTALAEAELEYPEGHVSKSIYAIFRVTELSSTSSGVLEEFLPDLYVSIWTTTPWTVPANAAVAVNPKLEYAVVELLSPTEDASLSSGNAKRRLGSVLEGEKKPNLIVASDLVPVLEAKWGLKLLVKKTFLGSDLENCKYIHPIDKRERPVVIGGDYITTESGTGLVHTAPGHGQEDYITGLKYKLPILSPVDDEGKFTAEAGKFSGLDVLGDGNLAVVNYLDDCLSLIMEEPYRHKYPYNWRTKKPTIFRATEQWFATVEGFRQVAMDAIKNVRWIPAQAENRICTMTSSRSDWCILRQMTWGVPIPVFYHKVSKQPLMNQTTISHIKSIISEKGSDAWWYMSVEELLPEEYRDKASEYEKGTDAMDVWFDSGSSWAAVLQKRDGLSLPADLYLEGSDQHRGRFQSSLLTSVATRGVAPYSGVVTHGFVLLGRKHKLSPKKTLQTIQIRNPNFKSSTRTPATRRRHLHRAQSRPSVSKKQGLEDHLGDVDFKIAGTRNGITAIQLDIKPAGIPLDIICECLEPALRGRLQILDHMEHEIKAPRIDDDRNSPRLATLKYSNDSIRRFIGPLGALKRKIEEETGARISVDDGTLTIVAKNQSVMDKVQEKIDFVIGREIEVGGVYKGIVTTVKEYGAFVEFNGGQQGLLHISELSHEPVSRVSDVVSIGQQLSVMCIGQDVRGNIKLSLKAPLPHPIKKNGYVDDASAAPTKPTSQKWASVGDVSNRLAEQSNAEEPLVTEYEADEVKPSTSSTSFLIRSTSECDEEEKSDAVSQDDTVASSLNPSFLIRSAAECDEQEKSAGLRENCVGNPQVTSKIMSSQKDSSAARSTLSAKDLRLGTKVTAKVYQIRARGLVLDLGVGLKGMYRFETNGKRDFEVGDELRVQCSSFTAKGVPVMSSVKEE